MINQIRQIEHIFNIGTITYLDFLIVFSHTSSPNLLKINILKTKNARLLTKKQEIRTLKKRF